MDCTRVEHLKQGNVAPAFTLKDFSKEHSLSDYKGKVLVIDGQPGVEDVLLNTQVHGNGWKI
ncbi:MAG: peroxiredoxin family protein [Butyricimonas faecihominis]